MIEARFQLEECINLACQGTEWCLIDGSPSPGLPWRDQHFNKNASEKRRKKGRQVFATTPYFPVHFFQLHVKQPRPSCTKPGQSYLAYTKQSNSLLISIGTTKDFKYSNTKLQQNNCWIIRYSASSIVKGGFRKVKPAHSCPPFRLTNVLLISVLLFRSYFTPGSKCPIQLLSKFLDPPLILCGTR